MSGESKTVSLEALIPAIGTALAAGGTAELTVVGHSMMPLLLDRVSRVRLIPVTAPKRGDMVLYRRQSGSYVLHRIVRCEADGTFTLCGDGQYLPERGIEGSQLIAVVSAFARREKWRDCGNIGYRLWWHLRLADRPGRRAIAKLKRIISGGLALFC